MARDLSDQIMEALREYGDEAEKAVREVVPEVAKEAAKKLRSESPKNTGKYRKGWMAKVENARLGVSATVYNKAKPGLAHLLEYGHVKRNGGRTRPNPHIAPVNDWAEEEALKKIEEALK